MACPSGFISYSFNVTYLTFSSFIWGMTFPSHPGFLWNFEIFGSEPKEFRFSFCLCQSEEQQKLFSWIQLSNLSEMSAERSLICSPNFTAVNRNHEGSLRAPSLPSLPAGEDKMAHHCAAASGRHARCKDMCCPRLPFDDVSSPPDTVYLSSVNSNPFQRLIFNVCSLFHLRHPNIEKGKSDKWI